MPTRETVCNAYDATKPWEEPGYDPATDQCNPYKYIPSHAWGLASVIIFGICLLAHIWLTYKSRRLWLISIVLGAFLEALGWIGRLLNAHNPDSQSPFMIQICCLIIAPAFITAGIYAMLGWLIASLGSKYSILKPHWYWRIFITGDVISLIIQGAGGGIASGGSSNNNISQLNTGSNMMLGGIIFQLLVMVLFCFFGLHFYFNFKRSGLSTKGVRGLEKIRWMWRGLGWASFWIVLRGAYRVAELKEGWRGYLMTHQFWFLFDMMPVALCLIGLIATHPYYTLPKNANPDSARELQLQLTLDSSKPERQSDAETIKSERGKVEDEDKV